MTSLEDIEDISENPAASVVLAGMAVIALAASVAFGFSALVLVSLKMIGGL